MFRAKRAPDISRNEDFENCVFNAVSTRKFFLAHLLIKFRPNIAYAHTHNCTNDKRDAQNVLETSFCSSLDCNTFFTLSRSTTDFRPGFSGNNATTIIPNRVNVNFFKINYSVGLES